MSALCRGLRYEGDITLKEVALAFQLRDAYDWDEDLEAAAAHAVSLGCVVLCMYTCASCCWWCWRFLCQLTGNRMLSLITHCDLLMCVCASVCL